MLKKQPSNHRTPLKIINLLKTLNHKLKTKKKTTIYLRKV